MLEQMCRAVGSGAGQWAVGRGVGRGAVLEVGGGWWARCLAAEGILWLSFKVPDR